jgi:hypothetical protein
MKSGETKIKQSDPGFQGSQRFDYFEFPQRFNDRAGNSTDHYSTLTDNNLPIWFGTLSPGKVQSCANAFPRKEWFCGKGGMISGERYEYRKSRSQAAAVSRRQAEVARYE